MKGGTMGLPKSERDDSQPIYPSKNIDGEMKQRHNATKQPSALVTPLDDAFGTPRRKKNFASETGHPDRTEWRG
jgi:hypothetical protein